MSSGFSGGRRIASQAERHAAALREVLTALPAPWAVLASRRASGADGPPWVRFVALHPDKGIALLDISGTDGAVPPFKDFLARAGISGLQGGRLPVVPVTVGADEVADVADLLDAAFADTRHVPGSPNWCDAVVETLLAAPDLMLVELHRNVRHATPEFPLSRSTRLPDADALRTEPRFGARGAEPRLALEADEPILPLSQPRTPRKRRDPSFDTGRRRADLHWDDPRSRRRWPVVPIAAGLLLLAVGAIALWYREAPSPAVEADVPASPPATAALTPPPSPPSRSPSPSTQVAVTPHAPAAKRDVDLPRAMLQPEIAATPPTPLPLPAAKLTPQPPEPVRAAAAPKPVHAAAAKPHPAPASAATDAALPAPIAAVLHPEAASVQPHASPAAAAAPQLASPVVASSPPQPGALAGSAAPSGGTVTVNGVSYVKGEQPHALGSLESSQAVTPALPPALASNGPAALPAAGQPREVVISRAPAPPITALTPAPAAGTASSGTASDSAVASGPPRDIVVSPAPALPSAPAVPASSNVDAPAASGPPSAIQVTPAPGNSSP